MKVEYDTSPLESRLTLRQTLRELRSSAPAFRIGFTTMVVLVVLPVVILVLLLLLVPLGELLPAWGALVLLLGVPLACLGGLADMYAELNEIAYARRFAAANRFPFLRNFTAREYPGAPFRAGWYIPYAIRADSLGLEVGHLRPVHRERRSNSTATYTYLRILLPWALPHIVVKRKGVGASTLTFDIADARPLRLEGEYGDRFTLYVPPGYEQDALYLFTPDVMVRFLDFTPDFDVEIVGNELYFYSRTKIQFLHPSNLRRLVLTADQVYRKFGRQAGNYLDERAPDPSVPASERADRLRIRGIPPVVATLVGLAVALTVVIGSRLIPPLLGW